MHVNRQNELASFVKTFSRGLNAWRGVSTAGVSRVLSVSNALVTFSDYVSSRSHPRPAPGATAAMHDEACASLTWITENIGKLRRILSNLEELVSRMRKGHFQEQKQANQPVIATMSADRWLNVLDAAVHSLQDDMIDKVRIIEYMEKCASGLCAVDRDKLEYGAEVWLEMPRIQNAVVDTVEFAYKAECAASEVFTKEGATTLLESTACKSPSAQTAPRPAESGSSAAIAFLLGRNRKTIT